jgi:hypothetical protein
LKPSSGSKAGLLSTKIGARAGMPAITGCDGSVCTSRIDPPVKNS